MKRFGLILLAVVFLFAPDYSYGKGRGSSKSKSSGGTVHVKSYTKRDGTHVRAHTRSAPRSKSSYRAPSHVRTTARSAARTSARVPSVIAPDSVDDEPIQEERVKARPSQQQTLKSTPAKPEPVAPTESPEQRNERLAAIKLKHAKAFIDARKMQDARDYLEEITSKYPDTTSAGEAKALLKVMPK